MNGASFGMTPWQKVNWQTLSEWINTLIKAVISQGCGIKWKYRQEGQKEQTIQEHLSNHLHDKQIIIIANDNYVIDKNLTSRLLNKKCTLKMWVLKCFSLDLLRY